MTPEEYRKKKKQHAIDVVNKKKRKRMGVI